MDAETIARALGGKKHGRCWLCKCPAHDDSNASLLIFDGRTAVQFRCQSGCDPLDVITALKGHGDWSGSFKRDTKPELTSTEKIAYARGIFDKASPASGTPVAAYLAQRGITLPTPARLHFARRLRHKPSDRTFPCMVGLVTDHKDRPLGIHRTFIENNAKASVNPAKMALGPVRGGAVRLAPVADEIMVGEGIETCLSVMQETGRPAWAALSAPGLVALVLPPEVHSVIILADGDNPGEQAAQRAADRWIAESRRVRIARPPRGLDFNDMLMRKVRL